MFILKKEYSIVNNKLYQYNQSDEKIKINGINSCSGSSIYINIRYFLVKDIIDKREVNI